MERFSIGSNYKNQLWMDKGICKGMKIEVFFPVANNKEAVIDAKKICKTCSVMSECLEYTLTFEGEVDEGIRGGTTRSQRIKIRRKANID